MYYTPLRMWKNCFDNYIYIYIIIISTLINILQIWINYKEWQFKKFGNEAEIVSHWETCQWSLTVEPLFIPGINSS